MSERASGYYEKLPSDIQRRINKAIDSLEVTPFNGAQIKKLTGKLKGLYRYRLGRLRIIYQVLESELKVLIIEIGPRGDIYK
ncbi:MAG: type II toxin-antitoxin system RelE/ParE family toxin [Nitrospirae bacterium]|nr:type II toxin-antitoxin system RelE/ParE family toxin [Nitrospirota bacterium]